MLSRTGQLTEGRQRPQDIIGLADFCQERGMDPRRAFDLMRVMNDRQVLHVAREEARFNRASQTMRIEARPLEDEGHDWGRIEARIPKAIYYQLMQQENFGYEGLMSDEGMKDILKRWPQCRVKAVSGKVVGCGFGSGRTIVKKYNLA